MEGFSITFTRHVLVSSLNKKKGSEIAWESVTSNLYKKFQKPSEPAVNFALQHKIVLLA